MDKTNLQFTLKDGRNLGFSEFGSIDGYPIIYCHGSQSSRLEMHYDMSFAINNGLRIITIDRPGHGLSDFNPIGSILGFAEDVKQLTQSLNITFFSVAGMSAGAPFALGIAYLFPNNINKVSIISGFAPYTSASKKHLKKEVNILLRLAKSVPFLLKILLKLQTKQLNKAPDKAIQQFLKIMSDPDQKILENKHVMDTIKNMFVESFRNGSKGIAYEISKLLVKDWQFDLSKLQVPVTFWQGQKDNNIPYQWAELMKSKTKNATLKSFPDEGHLLIFKHAKDIFTDASNTIK